MLFFAKSVIYERGITRAVMAQWRCAGYHTIAVAFQISMDKYLDSEQFNKSAVMLDI